MPPDAVVVGGSDDATLLRDLLGAVRGGAPAAVVDAAWPGALREAVVAQVRAAVADGRLGPCDLVLATSGSSGAPRAVVRSTASWDASIGPVSQVTGTTGDDVVWLPGPLTSTLSLYAAWHATALGSRLLLRDDPDVTAATVVHSVPSVLARLAAAPERVPALRTVVVAGDRLTATTREAAGRRGWDVVEYYGAAELSFVAHRRHDGAFTPFPGVDLDVRDDVVWVRSPYLSRGYLTSAPGPFRSDRGWATVGDRGALEGRDAGRDRLHLHGRGHDAVVTGGTTVVTSDVERHLAAVPGVRAVAVVGTPDSRLGEVVTAVLSGTATRRSLLDAAAQLPAAARPRRWVRVEDLPLTAAGKVSRADVVARLRDGRLPSGP